MKWWMRHTQFSSLLALISANRKSKSRLAQKVFRTANLKIICTLPKSKLIALLFVSLIGVACNDSPSREKLEADAKAVIQKLESTTTSSLSLHGELSDVFAPFSEYTELQRENMLSKVKGSIVQWDLPIYEIFPPENGVYKVTTPAGTFAGDNGKSLLMAVIFITPRDDADRAVMGALKTNDVMSFKGVLADVHLRTAVRITPAILFKRKSQAQANSVDLVTSTPQVTVKELGSSPAGALALDMSGDAVTYSNERFRFGLRYPPKIFVSQGESSNGDGLILVSPDGKGKLVAYGSHIMQDEALKVEFENELINSSGRKITYKSFRENWYVLSGIDGHSIFYTKRFSTKDHIVGYTMTYPADNRVEWERALDTVIKGFEPVVATKQPNVPKTN